MLATAGGVQPCAGDHCSKQSVVDHVNEICKQNDWPVGHHVLVQGPDGKWCYCTCSCLAKGSLVETTANKMIAIETFTKGGPVMAADTNFNWTQVAVSEVIGTAQIGQPNTVFVRYEGGSLTITSDHLFMVKDGDGQALLTADKLATSDKLVGPNGSAVAILEVQTGDFFGSFHNVSTNAPGNPATDANGHLLNTNGVISGDYALQTFWKGGALSPKLMHSEMDSRPVVGTLAYHAAHPMSDPTPEAVKAAEAAGISMMTSDGDAELGQFVIRRELDEEDDAKDAGARFGFVPLHRSGILEQLPAYKFSDVQRQALGIYIVKLFGAFYPDIDFRIDWWRRNVNIVSFPAKGALPAKVVITGGMLRVEMLDLASLSLAVAFSVANVTADPDKQKNVPYSDYTGAAAVMRNVWWEMDFVTKMEEAIEQLRPFFKFIPLNFGQADGPKYPSGMCRLQTYQNALPLAGIPDCAKSAE